MSSSALNGYDSNTSTSTPLLSNPTSTSTNATIQQAQQSASSVSNTVSNTMQNSPELANMTVGQLLGQTQRRNISVSHLNPNAQRLSIGPQRNQIRVVNNPNAVSISRQVGGAVGTSTPNQQPSAPERTQINRPVFHSYRFEDGRVSMPTRRLISGLDQQDNCYKIDPAQPNKAVPISLEAVRNEQKMAHAVITADQIRQMVYPHHQTVETSQTQSSATPQRNDNREDAIVDKVMNAGKGTVLDRVKLDKLVEQLDPTTLLEEDVKDALIQMVDDFVEQVLDRSCKLCLHRGSSTLEAKDVNFVLEQYYKMPKMVKTTDVNDLVKTEGNMDGGSAVSRNADLSAHNQRLALIKKTLKKP